MLLIRKKDTVIFADHATGKVIDIIATQAKKVYKIQKIADDQVFYAEERMVRLVKQCRRNLLLTRGIEVFNFLLYTLIR